MYFLFHFRVRAKNVTSTRVGEARSQRSTFLFQWWCNHGNPWRLSLLSKRCKAPVRCKLVTLAKGGDNSRALLSSVIVCFFFLHEWHLYVRNYDPVGISTYSRKWMRYQKPWNRIIWHQKIAPQIVQVNAWLEGFLAFFYVSFFCNSSSNWYHVIGKNLCIVGPRVSLWLIHHLEVPKVRGNWLVQGQSWPCFLGGRVNARPLIFL